MSLGNIITGTRKFKEGGELTPPKHMPGRTPEKVSEPTMGPSPEKFVAMLFECRDVVHLLHLKTESYAAHKALDKLYKVMLDYADSVAEILQGHMGVLDIKIPSTTGNHDPVSYISEFRLKVLEMKSYCKLDEIKNLMDEIAGSCSDAMYKLKILK